MLFLSLLVAVIAPLTGHSRSCADRVLLAATGDIMVHNEPQKAAHRHPEKFYFLWKPLSSFLQAADLTYGNLEAPVALGIDSQGRDQGDIGFIYDLKVYSGTNMVFNYHPQVLKDLRKVGFNILSTANNHSMDRRSLGVDRTLDELVREKWHFTGTRFSDGRGEWGTVTEVKNKKIFWLACTEHLNGNQDPHHQVLNCYKDQNEIEKIVQDAVYRYEAVILLPHWGDEYIQSPNHRQKKWALRMASLNVTAIIGSHPHVLQPLTWISNTLVAYSLGNFSAWQKGIERKTSAILFLDLRGPQDQRLKIHKVKALPISRIDKVMYPYSEKIERSALQYVEKHLGAAEIVQAADFQKSILSCE